MARLSSSLSSLPCVRILVLGDSGVGKTSLIHSLSAAPSSSSPSSTAPLSTSTSAFGSSSSSSTSSVSWTIGCAPHTLLLPSSSLPQGAVFVQLFDVGGHRKYAGSRSMFYRGVDGVLLVFDVGNRKSYRNVARWMRELVEVDAREAIQDDWMAGGGGRRGGGGAGGKGALQSLPVLVVGNKGDTVEDGGRRYDCMRDYGLEMVLTRALGKGREANLQLLTPFLHSAIERKERGGAQSSPSNAGEDVRRVQGGHQPLLRGPVYRKAGGSGGGGGMGARLGGRGGGGGGQAEEEADEEDEEDGELTIDMAQLELLSTPTPTQPTHNHRAASAAGIHSPTSSSSSLSRFLPARLLALSGSSERSGGKEASSRV